LALLPLECQISSRDVPEDLVPTYQYACTACGEQLEAVQAFTDAPLAECPACGGRLRKVFSAVGVVFKGSGFYKTDSRASSGGKDSGGKDTKDGGKKTESAPKTDAAPASAGGGSASASAPVAKTA
jgi:putative FmdB family regulatory protein